MVVTVEQIEQALHSLVGLPLSDMWRFAGWQRFEFGSQQPFVNTKGENITRAEYAIDVLCHWRIIGPEGIIVGSDDYDPERHDEQGKPFFRMLAETPPVVQSVKADVVGSVCLTMTGSYSLDILPMGASQKERWIFLSPGGEAFTLDECGTG